jgi:hypothetical protein
MVGSVLWVTAMCGKSSVKMSPMKKIRRVYMSMYSYVVRLNERVLVNHLLMITVRHQ